MQGLIIFLGVVVGIVIFLGIVFFVIYAKIKIAAKEHGVDDISINRFMELKKELSETPVTVSGMTNLLLPMIRNDFADFQESQLYNLAEKNLRIIFTSLSNKDKSELDSVPLVKDSISNMIDEYMRNDIDVNYRDVKFHNFAIKNYEKKQGIATVTIGVSVEYYYDKVTKNKKSNYSKLKKQTRYECKYIYIYDESLVEDNLNFLGINCPTCGGPIQSLRSKHCEYCGTLLSFKGPTDNQVNEKIWALSSYKEY